MMLGLVPPIAGLILFVFAWANDLLTHKVFIGLWWAAGAGLQFYAPDPILSLAGLLMNVVLGIYLSIRMR